MGYSVYEVNTNTTSATEKAEVTTVSFLYDREGKRKYLTIAERRAFLIAARKVAPEVQTFCSMLSYTGARISEVLALTATSIDPEARLVVFESLKKRRRGAFRAVPIPRSLISELERVHRISRDDSGRPKERLWPWSRTTAWKRVRECMALANIFGPQATPKGLRHAFGVASLQAGVPINLVRKWLGHARLSTTEIYGDAVGDEEQEIASKFWAAF